MSSHANIIYHSRLRTARDAGLRAPWWREYDEPHTPFRVVTRDGVELRGVHLRTGFETLLVYCHGFLSGKNYWHSRRWVQMLAADMDVIAFDFRGHGESGGATTFGEREILDLDAVIEYARRFEYSRIVVMGSSMGGAVAIRYAAECKHAYAVITMGAFAHGRFSVWALGGLGLLYVPFSREVMRRAYGTRIERVRPPYAPRDYVGGISPRPLLILHGALDPLIPLSHARTLYAEAREPKRLYIIPRGGHDTENLNARTKARVVEWLNHAPWSEHGAR